MKIPRLARTGTAILAVLATTLLATSFAYGQRRGTPPSAPVERPATIKVGNRALQRTAFQVNPDYITATCSAIGCSATRTLFSRTLQCDGAAGKTCTFYLHLDAQLGVSNFDNGSMIFLVDGVAPTPGPGGTDGAVSWNQDDPNSGGTYLEVHSFSVVGFVTNQTTNQQHNIQVSIHCDDINSDGCNTDAGFATLQAVVYTP
jgi:hypothetical protein